MADSDLDNNSHAASFDGVSDVSSDNSDEVNATSVSTSATNYDDPDLYNEIYFVDDDEKQMIGTYQIRKFDNITVSYDSADKLLLSCADAILP